MRSMIGLALNDPEERRKRRLCWSTPLKLRRFGLLREPKTPQAPETIPELTKALLHRLNKLAKSFRLRLAACGEDDRWASYSLSFMATRRCARIGKPMDLDYIYTSYQNAHKKFIAEHAPRHRIDIGVFAKATIPAYIEALDLTLDIEAALQRLGPDDARIVRMWYEQGATFQQIGASLGVHESTVFRRFKKALDTLREALRAYQSEGDRSKPDTIAERPGQAA